MADFLTSSTFLPAWLAPADDLAFPVLPVGVVGREIVAGPNSRNLPMIGAVTVLGTANLLMHLEAAGVSVPPGSGWRLGLAAVIVLISIVGGRIVPALVTGAIYLVVNLGAMRVAAVFAMPLLVGSGMPMDCRICDFRAGLRANAAPIAQ
jgi:uncharacterized protein involved in response to NO